MERKVSSSNIEFKAYYDDLTCARELCEAIGASHVISHNQHDSFFPVKTGKLKYRRSTVLGDQLVFYQRPSQSAAKQSVYEILDVHEDGIEAVNFILNRVSALATVEKSRETFRYRNALIHLDNVTNLGSFLEIEVEIDPSNKNSSYYCSDVINNLQSHFGIRNGQLSSYSYAELIAMKRKADCWQQRYVIAERPGAIVLIDGASCSGKTTLTHSLLQKRSKDILLTPRYTTRKRRENTKTEDEYVFIDSSEFNKMAMTGEFFEYRDFDFGMSYGLTWDKTFTPALEGRHVLGILNLASVTHVKRIIKNATTILINTPVEDIAKRLRERGQNTPDQIEERIRNAKTVQDYIEYYDHVIDNRNGRLSEALDDLERIVNECIGR